MVNCFSRTSCRVQYVPPDSLPHPHPHLSTVRVIRVGTLKLTPKLSAPTPPSSLPNPIPPPPLIRWDRTLRTASPTQHTQPRSRLLPSCPAPSASSTVPWCRTETICTSKGRRTSARSALPVRFLHPIPHAPSPLPPSTLHDASLSKTIRPPSHHKVLCHTRTVRRAWPHAHIFCSLVHPLLVLSLSYVSLAPAP